MKLNKKEIKRIKDSDVYKLYKCMEFNKLYDEYDEETYSQAFSCWVELTGKLSQDDRAYICDVCKYVYDVESDLRDGYEEYQEYKTLKKAISWLYSYYNEATK